MDIEKEFKDYWEDPNTRSLVDNNLRKLEESVVLPYLEPNQEIIDIGCGDGTSTLTYASKVKTCLALERSDNLRKQAEKLFKDTKQENITLVDGDVRELTKYKHQFDLAVTQRVLINITTWEQQKAAIDGIRDTLRPGGIYVMIENTYEGHDAMNNYRSAVGLKKISKHWHNLSFQYEDLINYLTETGRFRLLKHHTFDLYYLLTRVYVNMFASFEGFGKNVVKDSIFEAADEAARKLYETMGQEVKIGNHPSVGPIQGFVLRRMD